MVETTKENKRGVRWFCVVAKPHGFLFLLGLFVTCASNTPKQLKSTPFDDGEVFFIYSFPLFFVQIHKGWTTSGAEFRSIRIMSGGRKRLRHAFPAISRRCTRMESCWVKKRFFPASYTLCIVEESREGRLLTCKGITSYVPGRRGQWFSRTNFGASSTEL
mgnify:CR=1 FL=1